MMQLKTHFTDEVIAYTGRELCSHWIYRNFGMLGDSVVAFVGPCDVSQAGMVDLEDVLNNDFIYSKKMLNFIVEIFGIDLQQGVVLQRLFTSIIQDKINLVLPNNPIRRRGDDLFYQDTAKLSVSICTKSPTSILIHTGLNIDSEGTPVEAAGLASEMDLSASAIEVLSTACMRTLADEWTDIQLSCCKVRAVL